MGDIVSDIRDPRTLGEFLFERGELRRFRKVFLIEKQLDDFDEFFEMLIGSRLWSAQRVWARRVFAGQSSAIIAPTGVGKTVFGLVLALYLAHRLNKVSYIVLPTTTLLRQIIDKLRDWEEKLGKNHVLYFYSGMRKKEKEEFLERFENGDFKVLVTTSQFLVRNLQKIISAFYKAKNRSSGVPIDFLFVDDVDSFLRNPKNLDRALSLLGYLHFKKVREIIEKIKKAVFFYARNRGEFFRLTESDWETIFEARKRSGLLVVSSATGRVGSATVRRIFSTLFGFSIGSSKEGIRNVVDTFDIEVLKKEKSLIERTVELVKKLGSGGLVFVSRGVKSDEIIETLQNSLKNIGLNAVGVTAEDSRSVQNLVNDFREGKIDVLIGKASPYGLLVRGLDLPERIRYAIFVEVPHYSIKLDVKPNPIYLSFVIRRISPALKNRKEVLEKIRSLASHLIWLKPQEVKDLEEKLSNELSNKDIETLIKVYKEKLDIEPEDHKINVILSTLELCKIIKDFLSDSPIKMLEKTTVPFDVRTENGKEEIYILTADIKTYIQASGRTSRLFAGGLTKGLSIIISQNETLIKELDTKLLWASDTNLIPLSEIDLDKLIEEIDEDRKKVLLAWEGKIPAKGHLQTCLFIVESPTKAKTIASFFGRPSRRFLPGLVAYEVIMGGKYLATIVATLGHLTELITHKFIPVFDYVRENGKLVPVVKGYKVEELEWPYGIVIMKVNGETKYLPIFGPRVTCNACGYTFIPYFSIDPADEKMFKKTIEFLRFSKHDEIELIFTKTIVPLKCPRCGESENLYDRSILLESLRKLASESELVIIGTDPDIEGEKIAWDIAILLKPYAKEIKRAEFHEVTRSAIEEALNNLRDIDINLVKGQLLRRIEDRWIGFYLSMKLRDILEERNLSAGRVQSPVLNWIIDFYKEWKEKEEITIIEPIKGIELRIKGKVQPIRISLVDVKHEEKTIYPPPPLITDTLLNYASNLYGMSANETMKNAQKLFEMGLITYIRTDSTRVSNLGIYLGKRLVSEEYGEEYHVPRSWAKKGEEGAHECIRPTKPLMLHELKEAIERGEIALTEELPASAFNIYDLIVRFFMASQMKEMKVNMIEYTFEIEYEIDGKRKVEKVIVNGYDHVIYPGFSVALTPRMLKIVTPTKLPSLSKGYEFDKSKIVVTVKKVPKGRLPTEGDIVRMMKEKEIGRPSTYANILTKLKERQYVKLVQGRFLTPKIRGRIVNDILNRLHKDMVSEERTRVILKQIDDVSEGKAKYDELLREIHNEILEDMRKERSNKIWELLPEDLKSEIEKYKMNVEKRRMLYLLED